MCKLNIPDHLVPRMLILLLKKFSADKSGFLVFNIFYVKLRLNYLSFVCVCVCSSLCVNCSPLTVFDSVLAVLDCICLHTSSVCKHIKHISIFHKVFKLYSFLIVLKTFLLVMFIYNVRTCECSFSGKH